ncbi:MAG: hypothetical protein GY747_00635 [Planctomycetes bacterium]|nr:hypothetical protein [Planctomycetota bacterium]MCP4770816.1 hypothetical protein [Planctomycetota bacterium]MCP4861356.1 hypothetical protein [Planctomycetota bacterium]
MSQTLGQHDFDRLLEELEQRVLAHPTLQAEYSESYEDFLAGSTTDEPTKLRFREWFLIEHAPPSLGAPPAVAWAPESLQDDDAWQRLLESFFGIFQEVASDDSKMPILEDLWSGRQIRLDRPLPANDDNLVIVGRCAQGSSESHVLLPGCVFLAADGLGEALASDLSRIRAEQPRSRLSQSQCERLLLPFRQQEEPQQEAEHALEALEEALAGEPLWSADRLLNTAVEHGVTEALNILAFETNVDLEPIRTAMATLNAVGQQETEDTQESASAKVAEDDQLSPSEIESALAAFELARKSGKDLSTSFEELEQSLGLPVGESDPFAEVTQATTNDEGETMGPEDVPGMSMWLATFLWENEANGVTIEESDAREISAFLEHLVATRGASLDPEQVAAGDLLGYMLRSETPMILEARLASLNNFVTWLIEEQGSPLDQTLEALQESTGQLLRDVVTLNHELEVQQAPKDSVAWLKSVDPLQVGAEDGELVRVVGLPEDCGFTPHVGDCVMGVWHNAQFQLGAWLPAELLPKPVETLE